MSQSGSEMSSFLAELAGEATQKLEAKRNLQQDHQAISQSVNGALERTFKFLNLLVSHLNALEPEIPRTYALDGRSHFQQLKWKIGLVEYRKQSLADNALFDYVYFQARLTAGNSVNVARRWERFNDLKQDLDTFGLKTKQDMIELWRNRMQTTTFQVDLEQEFLITLHFQGNYKDGRVDLDCHNLDGFGGMKSELKPELLQTGLLDELGKFILGRARALPAELNLAHSFVRDH